MFFPQTPSTAIARCRILVRSVLCCIWVSQAWQSWALPLSYTAKVRQPGGPSKPSMSFSIRPNSFNARVLILIGKDQLFLDLFGMLELLEQDYAL